MSFLWEMKMKMTIGPLRMNRHDFDQTSVDSVILWASDIYIDIGFKKRAARHTQRKNLRTVFFFSE